MHDYTHDSTPYRYSDSDLGYERDGSREESEAINGMEK